MNVPDDRDLLIACAWALALALAVAAFDGSFVRAMLGLPMVLLISGHALLRAVGIKTGSTAEHFVYAIGASLVVGIAGGFVLDALDAMTPTGWANWYVVVVWTSSAVAGRHEVADLPPWPRLPAFRIRHALVMALAASLTTGAYALAVRDEAKQQQFKYTALWMLPSDDGRTLSLGIRSAEARAQRFDLEVMLDGHVLAAFRSVVLTPGETWTREIAIGEPTAAESGRTGPPTATTRNAESKLYRLEDGRLYRHVSAVLPGN